MKPNGKALEDSIQMDLKLKGPKLLKGLHKAVGDRPVGYFQVWPRSCSRGYREQLQLVLRAGLEPGTSGFQDWRPNDSSTLPPSRQTQPTALHVSFELFQFVHCFCLLVFFRNIVRKDSIWDYLVFRKIQVSVEGLLFAVVGHTVVKERRK